MFGWMVICPDFNTNWKPSAGSGAARSVPGVHDVPCPHPWLGIAVPLSETAPDEVMPELPLVLASDPELPLLPELAPEVVPELPPVPEEPPLPFDVGLPDDEAVVSLPWPVPLPEPTSVPVLLPAELQPAKQAARPRADRKANRGRMELGFMTTPRARNEQLPTRNEQLPTIGTYAPPLVLAIAER